MMTVCREVEAVSFNYLRREWNILDPALAEDFKQLEKVEDAEFSVVSETADQRTWIVTFSKDDGPSASYIYSRSCNVLCCAVLCRAVLCCAVLCCAVLCCAVRCDRASHLYQNELQIGCARGFSANQDLQEHCVMLLSGARISYKTKKYQ